MARPRTQKKVRALVSSTTYSKRKNPKCMDKIQIKEITLKNRVERKEQVKKNKHADVWAKIQAEASKL